MSERLDRLREGFAAFNRGDFEALRELVTDDVELSGLASAQPKRGKEAALDWLRPDAFESQTTTIREMRESEDAIFVEVEFHAVGRGSGIELRQPGFSVFEYEGDLIRRMSTYADREEALAAARLEPR